MKRYILLFVMMGTAVLSSLAQDDMYFVPKKKTNIVNSLPRQTYLSGSNRNVDEYNRMGRNVSYESSYQLIAGDSTMRDVITFTPVEGVYPDSAASVSTGNDFQLTRNMARWDGYTPTDAYWEGYDQGRNDQWAINTWHSPWYYSSYYSWYDPWYYDSWYHPHWSWHAGWYYDPWYYRPYHYYSWGWGGYYGGYYTPVRHRNSVYNSRTYSNGGYGRISAPSNNNVARSRTSGRSYVGNSNVIGNRSAGSRLSSPVRTNSSSTSPYSGNRSTSSSVAGNRSTSSSVAGNRSSSYNSSSSSSYAGNRSAGSFSGGGSRSGGSVGGSRGGGRRR